MGLKAMRVLLSGASTLTLLMLVTMPVLAQENSESAGGEIKLKAITITGEKVERSIQETASSVTVLSAEEIEKKVGTTNLNDVLQDVPNILFTDTVSAPVFRGMDGQGSNFGSGAFFGGTVPRARVNLDGHYLSFWETVFGSTPIWDVQNIEVFRGPQTTSQGANSIAGAVIVNTKDPTFTPEAEMQFQYGSRKNRRVSAMVSGPIIGNELAGRLAVDYSGRDTFIDYIGAAYTPGDTDVNFESLNLRGKLLWEPAEVPGLSAKLTVFHLKSNRPTSEAASIPYDELNSKTASLPSYDGRSTGGVLDVSYEFENGIKLSDQLQYSYGHMDRVANDPNFGGAEMTYHDVSNETRVNFGDENSTWSGVAGLFYSSVKSNDILHNRGLSDFDDKKQSVGLFSEVTYRFAERWALTGGLRYQYDKVERTGISNFTREVLDFDESYDEILPKISLSYDITPDFTVGGLISKGYNPGGVGLSFVTSEYYTFKPETVWNYELFARAHLLDDRLIVTGNIFYADHKNSQQVVPDYLNGQLYGSLVLNADEATSYGMELSASYQALDNLLVRGSLGMLHTKLDKITNAAGAAFEGNEFGKAPGYMFSLGADWDITEQVRLSADVRHTDGYYSTSENYPAYYVDSYTVANARITYAPSENWQLYAYVDNIFDERAATWKYDDRTAGGIVASMLEPREYGLGLKVKF